MGGLKRRANRHRRSLQKEVETILADAARMAPADEFDPVPELRLHTVSTGNRTTWDRDSIYGDDGR